MAILLVATVSMISPGMAQQQQTSTALLSTAPATVAPTLPPSLPLWQQTLYKTLTYQTAVNLADAVLFYGLIHANGPATLGFVVVNAASASAVYYGFEYAWQTAGLILGPETEPSLAEKTTVFQTLNAGRFFTVSYAFGGGIVGSAALTAAATVLDTAIFMTNEYAWGPIQPRTQLQSVP
jgi:uncharacterized membrane protein